MAAKRDAARNGAPEDAELVRDPDRARPADEGLVLARSVFPGRLPILPLLQRPLFPRMQAPMMIGQPALKRMLVDVARSDTRHIGLVLHRQAGNVDADKPIAGDDIERVGVIAEILRMADPNPSAPLQVLLGAMERFEIATIVKEDPFLLAEVTYRFEVDTPADNELKAYSLAAIKSLKELIQLNPLHKEEMSLLMAQSPLNEPGRLADFAAALTSAEPREQQEVLATFDVRERLGRVLLLLQKAIDISRLQVKISKQIEEKLSKQQRQFFLREQLKAIKKELGLEKEGKEAEVERFEKRLTTLKLTDEARERVTEELDKLRLIETASPEFNVSRTYLDWLTILPWGVMTEDRFDLDRARRILNRDHYGLDDVKDRILEFLAVGIRKGSIAGSILCFVGPPGVGKTSIGQSIAQSIGRRFYRFSVGGIRDEAEIKGHRRTYIGALPGKFLQAIKVCKSANPVIMLDEIDKISAGYHGDPASALLEVLDSEQNRDFLDHYLDVRFDLSNVFFICTANQLDTIPRPLLDRMEVIHLSGYILEEKLQIARRFLYPKQLKAHGVDRRQVALSSRAMRAVIDGYAREPGVRGLENAIKKIMRKAVTRLVNGDAERLRVEAGDVETYLGKRLFTDDAATEASRVGVATGLAWTSMGGDVLTIEAADVASGKTGFKQTGQLGSVMVESSEIAYTYVRAYLDGRTPGTAFFNDRFVHLHVPAGATPKDGPSAGITMAAALYSLATREPMRRGFAMTGELTLTGRVMPIGGIKEKTIAAKRAKIHKLMLPEGNRKDFDELPAHVRRGLTIHYVKSFDDVVAAGFRPR